jgi:gamma-glutamyltranspeptidase
MNRSNAKAWAVVTVASTIAWSCVPAATPVEPVEGEPAVGTHGMVSTAHPLATDAGLAVLQDGGNAFDAAVAIAAALNVVEPMMSGIGGYGTILSYSADEERVRFLNPSGRIPAGTDSDAYRAPTSNYRENRRGAKAVSTPGKQCRKRMGHFRGRACSTRRCGSPRRALPSASGRRV